MGQICLWCQCIVQSSPTSLVFSQCLQILRTTPLIPAGLSTVSAAGSAQDCPATRSHTPFCWPTEESPATYLMPWLSLKNWGSKFIVPVYWHRKIKPLLEVDAGCWLTWLHVPIDWIHHLWALVFATVTCVSTSVGKTEVPWSISGQFNLVGKSSCFGHVGNGCCLSVSHQGPTSVEPPLSSPGMTGPGEGYLYLFINNINMISPTAPTVPFD